MLPDGFNSSVLKTVNPVSAITPVLASAAIGSASQELQSKAQQLIKFQQYTGEVVSKLSDTTFVVKLNGPQVNNLFLKMDLPNKTTLGQSLNLQFVESEPTLSFILKPTFTSSEEAKVQLSQTGQFLIKFINEAQEKGISKQFEATKVVTQQPNKPAVFANDLRQALGQSGLFYESHLHEYSQGQMSLLQLKQEPQNQANTVMQTLVYHQLNTLENQRITWHGEVWPGQMMTWDVYQEKKDQSTPKDAQNASEDAQVATDLTLDFPQLGKVKAKLSVVNGHLRLNITAENNATYQLMQTQQTKLINNLTKNGQVLDSFSVVRNKMDNHG
jgi:hypothetical protein